MTPDVRAFYDAVGVLLPDRLGANASVRCFTDPAVHKHDDRTASCSVNVETGAWCCFGCGAKGGPYDAALALGRQPREAMDLLRAHGLAHEDSGGQAAAAGRNGRPPTPSRAERGGSRARATRRQNTLATSEADVARFRERLVGDADLIAWLCKLRGWTSEAILGLGLGYDGERVVFPVRDEKGLLVGVMRYAPDPATRSGAKMLADPGSMRELFPAPESVTGAPLWLVEGESDAISTASLDVAAVGVPGAGTWRSAWAQRVRDRDVIVCCDCDQAGRHLAGSVAEALSATASSVRVVDLDPGRGDGYDIGDLLRDRAARGDSGRKGVRDLLLDLATASQPLPEVDVNAIPATIARYELRTGRASINESHTPRTDLGNAQRFAAENATCLRHTRDRRMWLGWNGSRWHRDATGDAERAAKQTVRRMFEDAARLDGDERAAAVKWALASQSESRIGAMLKLAATEPEIALAPDALDRDPWKFSCGNGTLDLRTGDLKPHDPADLITLGTDIAYSPAATCPRWQRFLTEIFADDAELIGFVQRLVGYCLTGDIREHVLAVLHGAGSNGKSTFIGVLKRLLGDYAITAAFDTFIRQRNRGGPRNDLARLHRARLVTAAESGEGRRLDEATVKEITGGDTIAARFLYGEHFEFIPQFKLVLVTNHRPRVDGDDDAIWRRLRLVPFEQSFEGREDRELGVKLEAELPGILAWAIEGCLAWQRDGIGEAAAVTHATDEYRQDEDVLGAFLAERCITSGEVATGDLRDAYEQYCREVGEQPLGASVLGKRLAKRGIHRDQRSDGDRGRVYRGASLR